MSLVSQSIIIIIIETDFHVCYFEGVREIFIDNALDAFQIDQTNKKIDNDNENENDVDDSNQGI